MRLTQAIFFKMANGLKKHDCKKRLFYILFFVVVVSLLHNSIFTNLCFFSLQKIKGINWQRYYYKHLIINSIINLFDNILRQKLKCIRKVWIKNYIILKLVIAADSLGLLNKGFFCENNKLINGEEEIWI